MSRCGDSSDFSDFDIHSSTPSKVLLWGLILSSSSGMASNSMVDSISWKIIGINRSFFLLGLDLELQGLGLVKATN